ncbi:gluconate 2-dehydrogenase subunit 3 family protein, partial [Asticcacaulis biprosthecium]|uniref:gluconate 2-dehydrogenase subunit 3 family protein n=1 Tax=Asticcacaulis biprosthecium TaxID=76891 RepID=UPI001B7FC8D9
MTTRRQVLQGLIFSLGGAAALSAFHSTEAGAAESATGGFYTADELALVTFLADAIIPRTDTPGAVGAGVPAYMDHLYLTWAGEKTKADHR